jgi:lipopolysaccharide transport system ATP-binding protein
MSDVIISVENLGKKYRISHQGNNQPYVALRDVLSAKAKGLFKRLRGGKGNSANNVSVSEFRHTSVSSTEDFWALKGVSFEVKQGDVIGIIGRNGAGKSTLLKILSRITEPTTGRVRLKGRVASLLEVGTGFHPELTGRENIFLNGAILGMTRAEMRKKFDEMVAFAEVEKFLDTPVKRYSSGMYVRLAFAVAAHLEPEILIVDEVLAVGDAEFQKKCLGKMQEVSSNQGRTVLFVSHQLGAVRRLCTKACVLKNGQTTGLFPVETALSSYTSQLEETAFDCDLSAIPRRGNLGESAKLLRLIIPPEASLTYGEPLTIIFVIQCFTNLTNVVVGIAFDTLDGYRVMTLDSDSAMPTLKLSEGVHEIRFDLGRNPLHPSTFVCGAAIMTGGHVLDVMINCATWEVLPGHGDLLSARGFGGCRLPVKVSVSNLANSQTESAATVGDKICCAPSP